MSGEEKGEMWEEGNYEIVWVIFCLVKEVFVELWC